MPCVLDCRLFLCVGAVLLLWDCRPVFYAIWWPFKVRGCGRVSFAVCCGLES